MLLIMVIDGVSTKLMDKDDPESHVKKKWEENLQRIFLEVERQESASLVLETH